MDIAMMIVELSGPTRHDGQHVAVDATSRYVVIPAAHGYNRYRIDTRNDGTHIARLQPDA